MSPTPDKNGGRACHRFAEHEDLEVEHMMSLHLFDTCCWKIAGDLQDNHRPCMRGSVANPVSLKGRLWTSFIYSSLVALKLIHMFTLPRNGLIEPCALWRKVAYFWISFSALTPYKANSSQYSFTGLHGQDREAGIESLMFHVKRLVFCHCDRHIRI